MCRIHEEVYVTWVDRALTRTSASMDLVERVSANESNEKVERRHQTNTSNEKLKHTITPISSCLCMARYESLVGHFGLNEPNLLAKQTRNMRSLVKTQNTCGTKHKIREAQTYHWPSRTALHTDNSISHGFSIKGTIFTTGHLYEPLAVHMVTTLLVLSHSLPGWLFWWLQVAISWVEFVHPACKKRH